MVVPNRVVPGLVAGLVSPRGVQGAIGDLSVPVGDRFVRQAAKPASTVFTSRGSAFASDFMTLVTPRERILGEALMGASARWGREGGIDPEMINFAGLRNARPAGKELVQNARELVRSRVFESLKANNPQVTRADFDAVLKTEQPTALMLNHAITENVRGVVHYNYLAMHGVNVPQSATTADMLQVRRYLQDFSNRYDLIDAVRGINEGWAKANGDSARIPLEAERVLFAERGVGPLFFGRLERQGLGARDLKKVREFADRFATGESGKYLKQATDGLEKVDLASVRGNITRRLLTDNGFILPRAGLADQTMVSLLRDLASEDGDNIRTIVKHTNQAFARGVTNYYELAENANRGLLSNLGVGADTLKALSLTDEAIQAAHPKGKAWPVALIRAEQTKLLRDRLRVLPESERGLAVEALKAKGANMLNFDTVLDTHFQGALQRLSGSEQALVTAMTDGMTLQQKANFVTDLSRVPAAVRQAAFENLTGSTADKQRTVVDRLSRQIEQDWQVSVHRQAGYYPNPADWAREDDAFVKDWSVQGIAQLFNGLNQMAANGKVSPDLAGTVYVNMDGSAPSPGMVPFSKNPGKPLAFYKPGAAAYEGGTMGYRTGLPGNRDMIVLFDAAMKMPNADETIGVSMAEGTIIHESGHAIQLGGRPGMSDAAAKAAEKRAIKEWSLLSNWRERDGSLADGFKPVAGGETRYYKDPSVEVGERAKVVSDYGATDPVEDFAEYTRGFFNDPKNAMAFSLEKFLYMNRTMGDRYSAKQVNAIAQELGLGTEAVAEAQTRLRRRLAQIKPASA
jgi:hypothetical protein